MFFPAAPLFQSSLLLGAVFQGVPQQQHQGYPREGLHGQPPPADNVSTAPAPAAALCLKGWRSWGWVDRMPPKRASEAGMGESCCSL